MNAYHVRASDDMMISTILYRPDYPRVNAHYPSVNKKTMNLASIQRFDYAI